MVPELCVSDFDISFAYYTDILGFTSCFQRRNPQFAYLEKEGAQLMIEQLTAESWLVGPMEHAFGRGINLQIELSNIQATYLSVLANNATPFVEMYDEWYEIDGQTVGQQQFLVQDPDGYLLRFCQAICR